jgi:RNA polymerase-binding transcription factor DksA
MMKQKTPKKTARRTVAGKTTRKPAAKKTTRKTAAGKKRSTRKPYTRRELLLFERALLEEKVRILRQGKATDEVMESGGTDANSGEPKRRTHAADVGSESHQIEVASQLKQMESRTQREINDALKRISKGTYGICRVCDKPIRKARLEIVPHASICMKCMNKK